MQAAKFETLVLGSYALAMIACAWGLAAVTVWPRWLVIPLGGLIGLVLAIVVNALIAFALELRKPPDA